MLYSLPQLSSMPPLSSFCYSYFYLKKWTCPSNTWLDSSNMCSCPVTGCSICNTQVDCLVCDSTINYILTTSLTCQLCSGGTFANSLTGNC